jgi:small subunit ribosomal protein S4e
MVRGPRLHLKRLDAPKHWMLDKISGKWAPRPSPGPHKLRESLPLIILLRNRLKYALTAREVRYILQQRLIQVDGKVRTDPHFPSGFMDIITIEKTAENFRLLYDTKGRFSIQRITPAEAKYKLARVEKKHTVSGNIPVVQTNDGRTIRYPDPDVDVHDTVKIDIETGKITERIAFEVGNLVMAIGGHNIGRVGVIVNRERHPGSFDIVHIKDAVGHSFATRLTNVFVIGKGTKAAVSLPRDKGVKKTILEERDRNVVAEK